MSKWTRNSFQRAGGPVNEDIRISLDFWDHHKTIRLKKRLGYEGIEALTRLWFYAAAYRPNGHLTNMDNEDIAIAAHWNGDPDAFVNVLSDPKYPWLDKNGDHFYLHNWHKRNGYACFSKERSDQARMAAEIRWKKRHKLQKDNTGSNADENANGIESAMPDDANSNPPIPTPTPAPNPIPTPYGIAKKILTEINRIGKEKGIITKPLRITTHIKARLNDGYSPEDLLQAWKNCSEDSWFVETGKITDLEFIFRKSKIDAHINRGKTLRGKKQDQHEPKSHPDTEYTKEELCVIDECARWLLTKDWPVKKINTEIDTALKKGVKPGELKGWFERK